MSCIRKTLAFAVCILTLTTGKAVQTRRNSGPTATESAVTANRDNPAVWRSATHIRTRSTAPGGYAKTDVPRTGDHEYVLILVDFTDKPFTIDDTTALRKRFDFMFNGHGYTDTATYRHNDITYKAPTGSVSEYFNDQSFGMYNPSFRIVGPVHPSQKYAYYGRNKDARVKDLVSEVCDSLMARHEIDLTLYTRNGQENGNIDNLCLIYAGRGENYDGADPDCIYPHSDIVFNCNRLGSVTYACSCELFWDSDTIIDGIGTFCHEFAHTLGLPDFYYSSNSNNAAMGYWSLMDYGNYENQGFSPVGLTAFEKYSLGWMDIEDIREPGYYYLHDITNKPDSKNNIHSAYRLNVNNSDNDFIILENHSKTGWYKYHASDGLMVTAVSYNYNLWDMNHVNANASDRHYYILPADNDFDRQSNRGDLFPYNDIDSITIAGSPKLAIGNDVAPHSIYFVRKSDCMISFYAGPDKASRTDRIKGAGIDISITDGNLTVKAPLGSRLSVHDISGKTIFETTTSQPVQLIDLPGSGIWIIQCGNTVRKIQK